jgi:hypothetical protein
LRIIEDYYKVIQRQIKEAIRSPIQIHQDDEKRVEKIFCDILKKIHLLNDLFPENSNIAAIHLKNMFMNQHQDFLKI